MQQTDYEYNLLFIQLITKILRSFGKLAIVNIWGDCQITNFNDNKLFYFEGLMKSR